MSSMNKQDCGFALITTLLMLATLSMLLAAYLTVTRVELATMRASKDMSQGFYATDEAALVEALGKPVVVVPSSPLNLKITTQDDLKMAEAFLTSR